MGERVVMTGMGWVTPLGFTIDSVWRGLLAGESGISRLDRFAGQTFRTNFAAQIRGFDLREFLTAGECADHASAGLSTQYALAAATSAFKQAGLDRFDGLNRRRFGIYLGAGEGTLDLEPYSQSHIAGWDDATKTCDGAKWASVATAMQAEREIEQEPNLTVSHVAWLLGARGPASNCMTACAASTQAIGEAFELIRRGDVDVMIAGGAHSMIHPLGMTGFIRLTAMSQRRDDYQRAARPFDATRDGFVMGEGAAMVIIERESHALKRGATPLAEVAGFGSTADAFRITDIAPQHRGAQGAMRAAMKQAGISPDAVDADGRPPVQYICAHGTGTKENDKLETAAVKAVFGPLAPKIPFSSVKSMLGHLIQAAGAAGTIACVQAIRTGMAPPTINLQHPDPDCDLDHVPNVARDLRSSGGIDVCLNNSAGFGGQNDTLCVRKWDGKK
jgi:3-oxoacyl-[acyl-carrier-protein] synthase II